jgi:hypothetical protein
MVQFKNTWSLVCILALGLYYTQSTINIIDEKLYFDANWTNLRDDAGIYYAYLPALWIKKDWRFSFLDREPATIPEKGIQYWAFKSENGGWVPKMTMGKAFLDLPFFLVADLYVQSTQKFERTGFSMPYKYAIAFSSVFYAFLGFLLLRSSMLRFFTDQVTSITLLLIALATNLYHYSTHETGYTHPHNFFLLSTLIFLSIQNQIKNTVGHSLLFGALCGLLVLIRPINLLLLLPLPFFSQIFRDKKWSYGLLRRGLWSIFSSKHTVLALVAALLILLPQFFFWKIQTGIWLYYSYNDEGFFWTKPKIWQGLFSFRKGWFIYTPIMFFAVVGFYPLIKKHYWVGLMITLTFVLFVYVTFSWWCWWYGGGFGARTMIDFYPYMAFGLAALMGLLIKQNTLVKGLLAVVIIFTIHLNIFQTKQYHLSLIHWDSMTYESYKAVFLKEKFPENYQQLLSEPNYQSQKEFGHE